MNGIKKIEDWDMSLGPIQLRKILQNHRKKLIEALSTGGIQTYLEYKFNIKATSQQVQQLKLRLDELASVDIDISTVLFSKK